MNVQTTLVEPGKTSISGVSARAADRVPLALLATFLVWWTLLAIAPSYRQDWLLENVLVFIVLPLLI